MFDKLHDAASYDAYAGSYEKYIRILSDPLANEICTLARVGEGDHVLDIGTGSGVAARRAAKLVGATGTVVGIDLSAGMIQAAKQSVADWVGMRPQFRVMDAESLDFPDATFDAVTSLCAVRHFPDVGRAIGEMCRVLKPRGHLVVSMGYARPITFFALGLHSAKRLKDAISCPLRPKIVGPSYLIKLADRLLADSGQTIETEWGNRNARGILVRLVKEAGLEGVQPSWRGHDVVFNSATEFWEAQSSIVTEVRKRLAAARPETVALLKQRFLARAENVLRRGGKLVYPYGAFYVSGQRLA
jgi:SAM-dependent methyltransferase